MKQPDSVILDYRPQRVWTSPVDLNLFLAGTGAATYFLGALWESRVAETTGVLSVAIGALVTLTELGRPTRAWRALQRLGGSWMSRGVLLIALFVALGAISLLPSWPGLGGLPWETGTPAGTVIRLLGQILALGVMFYSGMLLSGWPAIPFWNTPLLPLMMMAFSFASGSGVVLAIRSLQMAQAALAQVEMVTLSLTALSGVSALIYLTTMGASTLAGRAAVRMILKGERRLDFYVGLMGIGLVLPLVLLLLDFVTGAPLSQGALRMGAAVAILVGGFMVRRIWLRAGVYGLPV